MYATLTSLLSLDTAVALAAGAAAALLAGWIASKKGAKYKAFEGYAITAVRLAEKAVPDGTPNTGAKRLDHALKTFLDKYRRAAGVEPDEAAVARIESWIATVHNALDAAGVLGSGASGKEGAR